MNGLGQAMRLGRVVIEKEFLFGMDTSHLSGVYVYVDSVKECTHFSLSAKEWVSVSMSLRAFSLMGSIIMKKTQTRNNIERLI